MDELVECPVHVQKALGSMLSDAKQGVVVYASNREVEEEGFEGQNHPQLHSEFETRESINTSVTLPVQKLGLPVCPGHLICVWLFCLHISLPIMSAWCLRGQKRVLDP